jgi:hypothetical protein
VKYDTVIGTIGKTQGVSSDRKPIAAARPMYAGKDEARDEAEAKSGGKVPRTVGDSVGTTEGSGETVEGSGGTVEGSG